ncbi:membrane protein [Thermopolyspora flexuosa]|jgi:hypothetical protein|uniref:General stress protein 17M-like domain-containing protein n=1 Tax=Thermopolyspora flexuosa TaxID=103836 RepID=A0A543J441_9ACTN|nr:general stress protein [Thermopolyspora flexuosa]PZN14216.1 MAG: hypothetical protein DIU75_21835 [Mycolicibacterium hassiacum]TQM77594.1 hypothetical protein FHX40_4364 [Thermopolyspora flexuosa]GGM72241.1 membrane protein [Thermopolyspora flexuosa]
MTQTLIGPSAAAGPAGLDEYVVAGSYPTYEQAQRAMGHLAEQNFPVAKTAIVGTNLRLVEKVLGRLTWLHSAGGGAATGAWFGLLIGLLVSLFTPGAAALPAALGGLAFGAVFGSAFGLVTHWLGRLAPGRRDVISRSTLIADRYDIVTTPDVAEDAKNLLIKYGWRTG